MTATLTAFLQTVISLGGWPLDPLSGFCIRKTPEAVRTDCNRLMVLAGMNDVTPEKKDAAM